jgi:hypothetical protein
MISRALKGKRAQSLCLVDRPQIGSKGLELERWGRALGVGPSDAAPC